VRGAVAGAAMAESPPAEAMKFRDSQPFYNAFLSYKREDRQRICEKEFTDPEDAESKRQLEEMKKIMNEVDPDDEDTQVNVLRRLYIFWNNSLSKLEQQMPDQAPKDPAKFPEGTLGVVLGGRLRDSSNSLEGLGDALVSNMLQLGGVVTVSYSRNAVEPKLLEGLSAEKAERYTHFQDLELLVKHTAQARKQNKKVVFFYTLAATNDNGNNICNEEDLSKFLGQCKGLGLLQDNNVRFIHTSSFHASSKAAGHEDNLEDNYGLTDYGASKVMQTMQMLEGVYSEHEAARASPAFDTLIELKTDMQTQLDLIRKYWSENPSAAASRSCPEDIAELQKNLVSAMCRASDALYEDTQGEDSIVCQLKNIVKRVDVVKISYMLSNTAVYKRFFVFKPAIRKEHSAWEFYVICSMKRLRIVISPHRGSLWHLAVAAELCLEDGQSNGPVDKPAEKPVDEMVRPCHAQPKGSQDRKTDGVDKPAEKPAQPMTAPQEERHMCNCAVC